MFIHCCDASIVQAQAQSFFKRCSDATLATIHDCFGTNYDNVNYESCEIKKHYYSLGFDDNEKIIEVCVLRPLVLRNPNNTLEKAAFDALTLEYAACFPKAENILANNKEGVLASCYWYPFSD